MIEEKFHAQLASALDELLAANSFVAGGKNGIHDGVYNKDGFRIEASFGGFYRLQKEGKKEIGSTLNFELEGIVPEEASEQKYWKDICQAIKGINDNLSASGMRVDNFMAHQLNGRQSAKVTQVRILYSPDSKPEDVAQAVNIIQDTLYQKMRQYAQPRIPVQS